MSRNDDEPEVLPQGQMRLTWTDEEGEEVSHIVPSKKEVCHDCDGHGMVLNESMRHHAYTSDDEEMHDPEFREEYFKRGGIYDVQCPTCKGHNVEEVVDESRLSDEQKKLYAEYEEHEEDMARMDAEDRHTRYMESGGYDY
jgi:predicted methyltransferase